MRLSLGKKNHTKQDQVNREVIPEQWNIPLIQELPAHPFALFFRCAQILADNLPALSFFMSSWLMIIQIILMITTHHLPYLLNVYLSPACQKTLALGVIFHLLMLIFEYPVRLKTYIWHGVISIHLLKHFNWTKKFSFIHLSIFIA